MKTNVRQILADNLALLAKTHRTTLAGLADRCGVSKATMHQCAHQTRSPAVDWLEKVATPLGLNAATLLTPNLNRRGYKKR